MSEIFSQARVDYCVSLSADSPVMYKTAYSNMVSTVLTDQILSVVRGVSKTHTVVYDILDYTVVIKNVTPLAIQHIEYRDELPTTLLFIAGSTAVNEQPKPDINPAAGFVIEHLAPMGTVTVSFSAVILPTAAERVRSSAVLSFLFSSNRLLSPTALEAVSNETVTYVEQSLFKEFLVHHSMPLVGAPTGMIRVASINTTTTLVQVKTVVAAVKQLSRHPNIPLVLLLCDVMIAYEVAYRVASTGRVGTSLRRATYHRAFREALFVPRGVEYIAQLAPTVQTNGLSHSIQGNLLLCDVSLLLSI